VEFPAFPPLVLRWRRGWRIHDRRGARSVKRAPLPSARDLGKRRRAARDADARPDARGAGAPGDTSGCRPSLRYLGIVA
jgi:hypothetical protein